MLRLLWRRRGRVLLVLLAGFALYTARGEIFNYYFLKTMKGSFFYRYNQDLVLWLTQHGFTIRYDDSPWDHPAGGGSGYWSNAVGEQSANFSRRLQSGERLNSSIRIICGWLYYDTFWVHWDENEKGKITERYYGSVLNNFGGGRCPKPDTGPKD